MTSYGGYGVSMTPQFSVFVAFLVERGCLFALPSIRGGSEFGCGMAQRRQTDASDKTPTTTSCARQSGLSTTGRTTPDKMAIFGGSNSGLLVGAAMTQRPDLFRAVVCIVPMLDMLRYHLFDNAHVWRDEFGTADDPDDFSALASYSPYHQVRPGVAYPATMIVSGDADRNCNPLHARKMTARLQAANSSAHPILLDYSQFRGHSPVLPLSERIESLTDRMAFLCDQLQLHCVKSEGRCYVASHSESVLEADPFRPVSLARKLCRPLRQSPQLASARDTPSPEAVERICSAVDMACIWYWKEALCLQRSAATVCLLKQAWMRAQMVIGAQQLPFRAHAWVEVDGRVVNDKSYTPEIYAVLDRC